MWCRVKLQQGKRTKTIWQNLRYYVHTRTHNYYDNTGDWCSGAGSWRIVLATNYNGGMIQRNASRHEWMNEWMNATRTTTQWQITKRRHLTCGINSLLCSVNLILFTLLLVHLILRISPHHTHSHHLSLTRPFSAVLKLISFTNPVLHSLSRGSVWTAFTDLEPAPH